ncbi:MAG: YqgE/AlgH family protein [Methylobacteriaceae bacterium]|nr:YqgE/AlgH family protein [Methylobacteriaceae bacterium]
MQISMRLRRLGMIVAALLLPIALAPAASPAPEERAPTGTLAGQLLVASPEMGDPRFDHAVILLVRQDKNGAMGIRINRPVEERSLASLLNALGDTGSEVAGTVRIYSGGPVQPEIGFVLHTAEYHRPETLDIDGRLSITSSREILRDIGNQRGPAKSLVAFGYAGWAAGQLEDELAHHVWFMASYDLPLIFEEDRDKVYDEAVKRRTQAL